MSKRRMFSYEIVGSDRFTALPMRSQLLYFHLGMNADDEGFIGNTRSLLFTCGATEDDLIPLIQNRLIYRFDSGVLVIRHWKLQNPIRKDISHPSIYLEEKAQLELNNNVYTLLN